MTRSARRRRAPRDPLQRRAQGAVRGQRHAGAVAINMLHELRIVAARIGRAGRRTRGHAGEVRDRLVEPASQIRIEVSAQLGDCTRRLGSERSPRNPVPSSRASKTRASRSPSFEASTALEDRSLATRTSSAGSNRWTPWGPTTGCNVLPSSRRILEIEQRSSAAASARVKSVEFGGGAALELLSLRDCSGSAHIDEPSKHRGMQDGMGQDKHRDQAEASSTVPLTTTICHLPCRHAFRAGASPLPRWG
jgi:hypothetical protein